MRSHLQLASFPRTNTMALYNLCLLLLCMVMASHAVRNYNVLMKGTELKHINKKFYSEETEFEINKYNETTDSINAVLDLLQDLPPDTMINIQSYELQNNKWQPSVVHINQTWCDFLVSEPYFMESIIRQSNYPDKCPVTANRFKVENFVIDVEKLPEQVPGEHWRYVFQQSVKTDLVLEFSFDIQIKRKAQLT